MRAKDILSAKNRDPITAKPDTPVLEAMDLLINNQISCLLVTDESGTLVGIVSDKDIFRHVFKNPGDFGDDKIGDFMTTDLIIGLPEDEVGYFAGVMTNNRIRHVPIVEEKKLIGLISVGDVVKTQLEDIKVENRYLKQYIDGSYPG